MEIKKKPKVIQKIFKKGGGYVKIANTLGLTRQAVFQWRRVPAEHVLKIEQITGIPRHELRRDLYPKP